MVQYTPFNPEYGDYIESRGKRKLGPGAFQDDEWFSRAGGKPFRRHRKLKNLKKSGIAVSAGWIGVFGASGDETLPSRSF